MLGDQQFAIDLCDEQAKANVNALYSNLGKDRAEQAIAQLVKGAGGSLKPRLQLTATGHSQTDITGADHSQAADEGEPTVKPEIGSWSEVFPGIQPTDLWPGNPGAVSANLTCWGNGAVNVRRASERTITQMCTPIITSLQIEKLLAARARLSDNGTTDALFNAAHLGPPETSLLASRLTTVSAVHSLWVQSRGHSGTQRSLFVRDDSNSDDPRTFSFQW